MNASLLNIILLILVIEYDAKIIVMFPNCSKRPIHGQDGHILTTLVFVECTSISLFVCTFAIHIALFYMKIISYNIADSKQWKIDRLHKLNADVFVVPEITCIEQAVIPDDLEMAWNGITWEFAGKRKWKVWA